MFVADGEQEEMHLQEDFDWKPLLALAAAYLASQQGGDIEQLMAMCGGCLIQ